MLRSIAASPPRHMPRPAPRTIHPADYCAPQQAVDPPAHSLPRATTRIPPRQSHFAGSPYRRPCARRAIRVGDQAPPYLTAPNAKTPCDGAKSHKSSRRRCDDRARPTLYARARSLRPACPPPIQIAIHRVTTPARTTNIVPSVCPIHSPPRFSECWRWHRFCHFCWCGHDCWSVTETQRHRISIAPRMTRPTPLAAPFDARPAQYYSPPRHRRARMCRPISDALLPAASLAFVPTQRPSALFYSVFWYRFFS